MWSVPYNRMFYKNWLGVGITTDKSKANAENLFDIMYFGTNKVIDVDRRGYYDTAQPVQVKNAYVSIEGTMGTSRKPDVNIEVQPVDGDNEA